MTDKPQSTPDEDRPSRRHLARTLGGLTAAAGAAVALTPQVALADAYTKQVTNLAALKAASIVSPAAPVIVLGYNTPNDGGGGVFYWMPGDTSPPDDGLVVLSNLSITGRWFRLRDTGTAVSLAWFGADRSGIVNAAPALIKALNASDEVLIPKGVYQISSVNVANGKTLRFEHQAILSITAGASLIVHGEIAAAWSRIFSGAGAVAGLRYARPQWWGALGDATSDDQPALQAAHDALTTQLSNVGGTATLELGVGQFLLGRTLVLRPQQNVSLRVIGAGVTGSYGSRFIVKSNFNAANPVAVQVAGHDPKDIARIADFDFADFAIVRDEAASPATMGFAFGEVNKSLEGVQFSEVKNVHVSNFSVGFRIAQCRLVRFDRCSVWVTADSKWADSLMYAKGIVITVDSNNYLGFTGDLVFRDCQMVPCNIAARWGMEIICANAGQKGISGIKLFNCTFYPGARALSIYAGSSCGISDIWVDQCQFDGHGNEGVHIEAQPANVNDFGISDVRVTNCYFQGLAAAPIWIGSPPEKPIRTIRNVQIHSNWFNGINSNAIYMQYVSGAAVTSNIFSDINGGLLAAIEFWNVSNFTCTANSLRRTSDGPVIDYFISVQQSQSTDFCITGNTAGGITRSGVLRELNPGVRGFTWGNIS